MDSDKKTLAQLSSAEAKEKRYITVEIGSTLSGYTKDYLERLCRLNQVEHGLFDGQIVVELESLLRATHTLLMSSEGINFVDKRKITGLSDDKTQKTEAVAAVPGVVPGNITPIALDTETSATSTLRVPRKPAFSSPVVATTPPPQPQVTKQAAPTFFVAPAPSVKPAPLPPPVAAIPKVKTPPTPIPPPPPVQFVKSAPPPPSPAPVSPSTSTPRPAQSVPIVATPAPVPAQSTPTIVMSAPAPISAKPVSAPTLPAPPQVSSPKVVPPPAPAPSPKPRYGDKWDELLFGGISSIPEEPDKKESPAPALATSPSPATPNLYDTPSPYRPVATSVDPKPHHDPAPLFPFSTVKADEKEAPVTKISFVSPTTLAQKFPATTLPSVAGEHHLAVSQPHSLVEGKK